MIKLQPCSVMPFISKYMHSYKGIYVLGSTTLPSRVVHIPYLRFCYSIIDFLITKINMSDSADVDSA